MKVGIVADTHDEETAISKAVKIFNEEGVEVVIHAGDFVAPFTVQSFRKLKAPLIGVFGNNDGDKLLLKQMYKDNGVGELHKDPHEFELGTKKMIVTHRPMIVKALATSGIYDAVIYGHTHKPVIERYQHRYRYQYQRSNRNTGGDGGEEACSWLINPGECCGYITGRKTVVVLDLEEEAARIVKL